MLRVPRKNTMTIIKRLTRASLLLLFLSIALATAVAQQRRPPTAKVPQKGALPTQPAPTFETVLASDNYKIYGEIRGVGQLIRSSSVNVARPNHEACWSTKRIQDTRVWLNRNAERVMTYECCLQRGPPRRILPEMLVAIEFASRGGKVSAATERVFAKGVPYSGTRVHHFE
jgi:hypothetical protein